MPNIQVKRNCSFCVLRLSLKMLHQNKKTNFGSSFYLSKTEGLGMVSIRIANCMELRLVRAWHQPTGCISPSPSVLDSIQCSALIGYEKAETGSYIEARLKPCFFLLAKRHRLVSKQAHASVPFFELDTVL